MNLLKMSLSAALMIVAILFVRVLTLERLPRKTFSVLWAVVMIRLIVPFSIPSELSIYSLLPNTELSAPSEQIFSPSYKDFPLSDAPIILKQQNTPPIQGSVPNQQETNALTQSENTPVQKFSDSAFSISPFSLIWGAGFLICAAFFGIGYLSCIWEFQMSLPVEQKAVLRWANSLPLRRRVQVRQHDQIHTPLTYGIFSPVILLPKNLLEQESDKLPYVLTHEYSHIRHWDNLTKQILTFAVCLHWFNPLVWVMYLFANRDLELACDEDVLLRMGEQHRRPYALALIELEEKKHRFASLYSNFSRNGMEERIVSIMKMKKASFAGIAAALMIVGSLTTVFATSQKPDEKPVVSAPVSEKSESKEATANSPTKPMIPFPEKQFGNAEQTMKQIAQTYSKWKITYNEKDKCLMYDGKRIKVLIDNWCHLLYYQDNLGEINVWTAGSRLDDSLLKTHIINDNYKDELVGQFLNSSSDFYKELFASDHAFARTGNLDFQKYFAQFKDYGLHFYPDNNGVDGKLVYNNRSVFQFRGEDHPFSALFQDIYGTLSLEEKSNGKNPVEIKQNGVAISSMFSFKDYGFRYDYQNCEWLFQNQTVRTVLDGKFVISPNPSGKISTRIIRDESGMISRVEVISNEEADKQMAALLKPESFIPPVKNPTSVESMKNIPDIRAYCAPEGTSVSCSVPGEVIFCGFLPTYGNTVQVFDEKGVTWTYTQLKDIAVQTGQTLAAGDLIGSVGKTGNAQKTSLGLIAYHWDQPLKIEQMIP